RSDSGPSGSVEILTLYQSPSVGDWYSKRARSPLAKARPICSRNRLTSSGGRKLVTGSVRNLARGWGSLASSLHQTLIISKRSLTSNTVSLREVTRVSSLRLDS